MLREIMLQNWNYAAELELCCSKIFEKSYAAGLELCCNFEKFIVGLEFHYTRIQVQRTKTTVVELIKFL